MIDLEKYDYVLPPELIRKEGVEPRDSAWVMSSVLDRHFELTGVVHYEDVFVESIGVRSFGWAWPSEASQRGSMGSFMSGGVGPRGAFLFT